MGHCLPTILTVFGSGTEATFGQKLPLCTDYVAVIFDFERDTFKREEDDSQTISRLRAFLL
jgi:hypothetical protein